MCELWKKPGTSHGAKKSGKYGEKSLGKSLFLYLCNLLEKYNQFKNRHKVKKIKSALISVFYKDGLEPIVRQLAADGVKIYSTGGTLSFIEGLGVEATAVESLTGYPSILGGRVKTLHPKVFGGILARRDNTQDGEQMKQYEIPEIDLVIVDLYPFEQTVASGADEQAIIEKIDIGGISLIRAAAKNYKDVLIVPSVDQYAELLEIITSQQVRQPLSSVVVLPLTLSMLARITIPPSSTTLTVRSRFRSSNAAIPKVPSCATERTHTRVQCSSGIWIVSSINCTARRSPTTTCSISMQQSI